MRGGWTPGPSSRMNFGHRNHNSIHFASDPLIVSYRKLCSTRIHQAGLPLRHRRPSCARRRTLFATFPTMTSRDLSASWGVEELAYMGVLAWGYTIPEAARPPGPRGGNVEEEEGRRRPPRLWPPRLCRSQRQPLHHPPHISSFHWIYIFAVGSFGTSSSRASGRARASRQAWRCSGCERRKLGLYFI